MLAILAAAASASTAALSYFLSWRSSQRSSLASTSTTYTHSHRALRPNPVVCLSSSHNTRRQQQQAKAACGLAAALPSLALPLRTRTRTPRIMAGTAGYHEVRYAGSTRAVRALVANIGVGRVLTGHGHLLGVAIAEPGLRLTAARTSKHSCVQKYQQQ